MADIIWMSDAAAGARYPHYHETALALLTVLERAEAQGVTAPEFASLLATLHAKAIARLRPDASQIDMAVGLLRQAILAMLAEVRDDL